MLWYHNCVSRNGHGKEGESTKGKGNAPAEWMKGNCGGHLKERQGQYTMSSEKIYWCNDKIEKWKENGRQAAQTALVAAVWVLAIFADGIISLVLG